MSEQLHPSPRRALRKERRQARREMRRWAVDYDLAYDGGGSTFTSYYRTRGGAKIAAFWNAHIASWGGTAVLIDTEAAQ